jgi:hypothetical protein
MKLAIGSIFEPVPEPTAVIRELSPMMPQKARLVLNLLMLGQ